MKVTAPLLCEGVSKSQSLKTYTCMHMVTFRAAITVNMFGCSLELRDNTPGTRVGPGFYHWKLALKSRNPPKDIFLHSQSPCLHCSPSLLLRKSIIGHLAVRIVCQVVHVLVWYSLIDCIRFCYCDNGYIFRYKWGRGRWDMFVGTLGYATMLQFLVYNLI